MNKVLSEKDYQQYILQRLSQDNGYRIRPADQFDRLLAMDREMLFAFLTLCYNIKNGWGGLCVSLAR